MNKVSRVDSVPQPSRGPHTHRGSAEVEAALTAGLSEILGNDAPAPLAEAMRHAVLGPGSRFRPRLLFAVAESIGRYDERFASHAATAIELLHAASLVHDDLPAFDDASVRRGVPTVHVRFGEAIAVLAGDALIVGAYEHLHTGVQHHPRGHEALRILFRAGGAAAGLAKGQALELLPCEGNEALSRYHHAKTGVLFEAAAALGALSAHADPGPWLAIGRELGLFYQHLDDLADVLGDPARLGKDVGKDARHGRPSRADLVPPGSGPRLVAETAMERLTPQIQRVREAVPVGAEALRRYLESLLQEATARMLPLPGA